VDERLRKADDYHPGGIRDKENGLVVVFAGVTFFRPNIVGVPDTSLSEVNDVLLLFY